MTALVGTGGLVRLALRRDRIRVPIWLGVFLIFAVTSAVGTVGLYPTVESRVQAAQSFNGTTSLVALYGRIYDPTSLGSLAMIKALGTGAIFVGLLSIFTMVRHTRAEEESGRSELLGATVVGRLAPLTAALIVAVGLNLVLAVASALALIGSDLPADGSIAFGLAWGGVGIAFAAIAGVAAQLTRSARAASGISVAVLGLVYVLRAIGDTAEVTGPRWLTWLSPFGWGQQFRPYAGNRWWVLLITLGFAGVAAGAAYALAARRDFGAGLVPDRPGPATASRSLRSPLALAWRLHRGSLLGWAAGFVLLGLIFGNIASTVGEFLETPQARQLFAKLGGTRGLTDSFIAAELSIMGVIASAYGVQAAMRLRSEEVGLRAEPILATTTGRVEWATSHVSVAVVGSALLMVLAGAAGGLAHGAQVGDMGQFGRVFAAALVQVPAAWVLAGIVVAAFGLAPRLAMVGWAALAGFVLLGEVGPLLEFDQLVMDLSPYAHTPKLPGGELTATPLVVLTAAAAGLVIAGLAGFRRRDIATS